MYESHLWTYPKMIPPSLNSLPFDLHFPCPLKLGNYKKVVMLSSHYSVVKLSINPRNILPYYHNPTITEWSIFNWWSSYATQPVSEFRVNSQSQIFFKWTPINKPTHLFNENIKKIALFFGGKCDFVYFNVC